MASLKMLAHCGPKIVRSTFVLLVSIMMFLPRISQTDNAVTFDEILEQRRSVSESAEFLGEPFNVQVAADVFQLAEALDISSSFLVDATVTGAPNTRGVFDNLGVIRPRRGDTFVLLSSGVAGTPFAEPGTDFEPEGPEGDKATLTLTLNIPEGINRLSFTYNFLSAEHPEFIGSQFDDRFSAVLTDAHGSREIARESVNSSEFSDVSTSTAGGSGFDLFTDDPTEVDMEFGTGLPDAGLTGFKTVNAPVQGGTPVILKFTIEDERDGILDTAVILDNVILTSLEAVDPNDPEAIFLSDGQIITDREVLAQGGKPRIGAVADGVTQVLLRSTVTGPGDVEFCLANAQTPVDGGLALLGDTAYFDCVTDTVAETSQGFMAYAVYRAPDEFARDGVGTDENAAERPITLTATFTSSSGDTIESEFPFKLVRPPVILVHGLWSNGSTWTASIPIFGFEDIFPLVEDTRFMVVHEADYKDTNAHFFSTNEGMILRFIKEANERLRNKDFATTQVDIAGHSMGGILSRNHISRLDYRDNKNFNAGDVHKLFTLNTPHTGSLWANAVNGIRSLPFGIGEFFESKMADWKMPVDLGALDDLAKGSEAINAISKTPVPAHALVGIGCTEIAENIPGKVGQTYTVINFFANSSEIFQGLQNDCVVGRQSQEGGMPTSAFTVFEGIDSIHNLVTGSGNYSDRIIDLLNTSADEFSFDEFPAPATLSSFSVKRADTSSIPKMMVYAKTAQTTGLKIIGPSDGAEVSAGETVRVVVVSENGVMVDSVLVGGPDAAMIDDAAPFELDFAIPVNAVGTFPISAIGKNAEGNFFGSNTVTLQVRPPAELTSIALIPQEVMLFDIGETRSVAVRGSFDDGVTRDLTDPSTGTEYMTANPDIVTISLEGVVSAVGFGTTTIIARNGDIQDSIGVIVLSSNQPPVADAGLDRTEVVGSTITLDGSGSFDPDNGPEDLTYEWLQIVGPVVSLADATTALPSFTPSKSGEYSFGLVVRDGLADSSPSSVTITAAIYSINIEITPPAPTSEDFITITASGEWNNSCAPTGMDVSVNSTAKTIRLHLVPDISPDTFCTQVITPWEISGDIGILSEGRYMVEAFRIISEDENIAGTTEFEVVTGQ